MSCTAPAAVVKVLNHSNMSESPWQLKTIISISSPPFYDIAERHGHYKINKKFFLLLVKVDCTRCAVKVATPNERTKEKVKKKENHT